MHAHCGTRLHHSSQLEALVIPNQAADRIGQVLGSVAFQLPMIIELTGTKSKLEAFIDLLEGYEILELARTGITGLSSTAAEEMRV